MRADKCTTSWLEIIPATCRFWDVDGACSLLRRDRICIACADMPEAGAGVKRVTVHEARGRLIAGLNILARDWL